MDKKTLTLIGVAGLGLAALYIWSKSKQKNFANLKGGLNTSNCVEGTLGIGTYDLNAMPMRCHWSCQDKNTGDLLYLGPTNCPASL
jgi:hypothetical protein